MRSSFPRFVKIVTAPMALLFLLSVVVQYNDPDPYVWMPVYGAAAVACGLELAHKLRWWFPMLVGIGSVVWAATIAPHVFGQVPFLEMFSAWEMKNTGVGAIRPTRSLRLGGGVWFAKSETPAVSPAYPDAKSHLLPVVMSKNSLIERSPAPSDTTAFSPRDLAAASSIISPPTERPMPPILFRSTSGRFASTRSARASTA